MKHHQKTIIIGGGLAGLCVAWHLIKSGHTVTLVDAGSIGERASSKAAGMITPASEVHLGETALMDTFLRASLYYDSFINTLTNDQPQCVDFHRNGSLMCAIDDDGKRDLTRLMEFQNTMGLKTGLLTRAQLADMEPLLSPQITMAAYAQNEAHVDNIKLIALLKENLIAQGCVVLENKKVVAWKNSHSTLKEITLDDAEIKTLTADQFVFTTGLNDFLPDLNLPLRPVKGQVVTVQCEKGTLSRPVRIYHRYPIYLVPRNDGRIVIGATSEELSDENVTAGGVLDLIYAAWQALPLLYEKPLIQTWAGLRPTTPDHKPIFGQGLHDNSYILTGLYRHGIMLAPFAAKELVAVMNGEKTEMDWMEFGCRRFNSSKISGEDTSPLQ